MRQAAGHGRRVGKQFGLNFRSHLIGKIRNDRDRNGFVQSVKWTKNACKISLPLLSLEKGLEHLLQN